MTEKTTPLLRVADLSVAVAGTTLVDGVRFDVAAGEIMALVGESGCGKSMTALALMRLLPNGVSITGGEVILADRNLRQLNEAQMEAVRGNDLSMIFQEPVAALNPLMTVGDQVVESLRAHQSLPRHEAMDRALEMFELVGIADPRGRMRQYPFELSGGMCQRIMIASALICGPSVLIADEPTTALDVTIQAQILKLIKDMCAERQTGVVLITHDIGVVADTADRVAVMYAGRIVERGSVFEIFAAPRHPYTHLLLKSAPRLDDEKKQRLHVIDGLVPDPLHWPAGCRFHPRCPFASEQCRRDRPPLDEVAANHMVACWHQVELAEAE